MDENTVANTFWITGPRWTPKEYYEHHYRPIIDNLAKDTRNRFVVGDSIGVESWAQAHLAGLELGADRVTVFLRAREPPSESARRFAVDDFSESETERHTRMRARARHTICFLPQFGTLAAAAGALPLEGNLSASARRAPLSSSPLRRYSDTVVAHSEPYDERFEKVQRMLYALWYAPRRELEKTEFDALVDLIKRTRPAARSLYAHHSD